MSNVTILLAEEDERQANLITRALSQNTSINQVIGFSNGQDVLCFLFGLSIYNKPGEKYVLILDAQLSQVSGIEILKVVKKNEAIKSMPVIIISSTRDTQTMDMCYRLGCNAFINKPIDLAEFERLSMLDFSSAMQIPNTPAGHQYTNIDPLRRT